MISRRNRDVKWLTISRNVSLYYSPRSSIFCASFLHCWEKPTHVANIAETTYVRSMKYDIFPSNRVIVRGPHSRGSWTRNDKVMSATRTPLRNTGVQEYNWICIGLCRVLSTCSQCIIPGMHLHSARRQTQTCYAYFDEGFPTVLFTTKYRVYYSLELHPYLVPGTSR